MCNTCNNCKTEVEQLVPNGLYDYKFVSLPCGSTGINGDELRCDKCEHIKPWYICDRHGTDVSEHDCPYCG
jgi:uncharacterized protein CbrC (UPF0167 family)